MNLLHFIAIRHYHSKISKAHTISIYRTELTMVLWPIHRKLYWFYINFDEEYPGLTIHGDNMNPLDGSIFDQDSAMVLQDFEKAKSI